MAADVHMLEAYGFLLPHPAGRGWGILWLHHREKGLSMRVTHLYHSGFIIEFADCTLLFDWFPTSSEQLSKDFALINPDRKLYVFVSHVHPDHYFSRIWKLAEWLPKTDPTFIVDGPIAGDAPSGQDLDVLGCEPEQIYEVDERMELTTLNSTDEGLAFCVDVNGKTVYHAGDLSVWWWPERELELNQTSEKTCSYFLEVLEGKHIDLAMLPITPRAGEDGDRGIELFMKQVGADLVVPMHYADMRSEAMELAQSERLAPWRDRIRFDDQFEL